MGRTNVLCVLLLIFAGFHHAVLTAVAQCETTVPPDYFVLNDRHSNDFLGSDVSVVGKRALVGSSGRDFNFTASNSEDSGGAYLFTLTSDNVWTETHFFEYRAELDGLTAYYSSDSRCGESVSMIEGQVLMACPDAKITFGTNERSGKAILFTEIEPGIWNLTNVFSVDEISTSYADQVAFFDEDTLAIACDDCYFLVTGSPNVKVQIGRIDIFQRDENGTWVKLVELSPAECATNTAACAAFANGHNWAHDGNQIIASSVTYSTEYGWRTGAAWIFSELIDGEMWNETARLIPDDVQSSQFCGHSTALYNGIAIVSCGYTSGHASYAYVWKEVSFGGNWKQLQKFDFSYSVGLGFSAYTFVLYEEWALFTSTSGVVLLHQDPVNGTYAYWGDLKQYVYNEASYVGIYRPVFVNDTYLIMGASYADHECGEYDTDCTQSGAVITVNFAYWNCSRNCEDHGCQNDGTCQPHNPGTGYTCHCNETGFVGEVCEIQIDECDSSPCLHDGNCTDLLLDFVCNCNGTGYEGDICNSNIDECTSSPCLNNGLCTDMGAFTYACDCAGTGFDGTVCQSDFDDCISSPCMNDGDCVDAGINSFFCNCKGSRFTGPTCSDMIDTTSSMISSSSVVENLQFVGEETIITLTTNIANLRENVTLMDIVEKLPTEIVRVIEGKNGNESYAVIQSITIPIVYFEQEVILTSMITSQEDQQWYSHDGHLILLNITDNANQEMVIVIRYNTAEEPEVIIERLEEVGATNFTIEFDVDVDLVAAPPPDTPAARGSDDDETATIIVVVVVCILVLVGGTLGAWYYNKSQRKTVKNFDTGETMTMPT